MCIIIYMLATTLLVIITHKLAQSMTCFITRLVDASSAGVHLDMYACMQKIA